MIWSMQGMYDLLLFSSFSFYSIYLIIYFLFVLHWIQAHFSDREDFAMCLHLSATIDGRSY